MRFTLTLVLTILVAFNANADRALNKFDDAYDALLQKFVKDNQMKEGIKLTLINYKDMEKSDELLLASELIKDVKLKNLNPQQQLAFWINAYNFYTLELMANNNKVDSIKDLGSFFNSVWDKYKFEIDGKRYSLNFIEHSIIRQQFRGESRIHFALVCASLSCPDLLNEPYTAEILDVQLEQQTKNFLNNPTKGVMMDGDKVRVSKLFKWYKKDFPDLNTLAFIQKYKEISYIHGYMPYNWNLNSLQDE